MRKTGIFDASVIIPVYNQMKSLLVTLKSFGSQLCSPWSYEVIVVDDGSTDGLQEYIERTELLCPVRYIRQENRGRAAARNAGAAQAKGRRMIFCDADRFPGKSFIKYHMEAGEKQDRLAVIGCPWDYFGNVENLNKMPDIDWISVQKYSRRPIYYSKLMNLYEDNNTKSKIAWASFLAGNSSLDADDFERVGGFDTDFKAWGFEHFEFGLRLQESGVCFYSCPEAGNYHIPHRRGAGYYKEMIENSTRIIEEKHPGYKVGLLKDFLFGKISLQEFELGFGEILTEQLRKQPPIFFGKREGAEK